MSQTAQTSVSFNLLFTITIPQKLPFFAFSITFTTTCPALTSLDISAAFGTIDHFILNNNLQSSFKISGLAHCWTLSDLTNHTQIVIIWNSSSDDFPLSTGVPYGSVLHPLVFSIYTSQVAHFASDHNVPQQQYADDTTLCCHLSRLRNQ